MDGFDLLVITPHKKIYQDKAEMLSLKNSVGEFSILAEHENMLTPTVPCKLTITKSEGGEIEFFTSGGMLEIKDGNVVLCADTVESREEIDVKRAEASKEKTEKKLDEENASKIEDMRTKLALNRAIERIDFAKGKK
ncbi:ATP synthase F1 subunit epsilon [uncultured Clostridium sp.]|uniref:ATP synthase F1 subunit epsilon n=1 Tax=uncultured Clostridium sp. TaxID=59620 RepID=UPI00261063BD|nr:ATP synthase F1 subunit epsilon [uncultured Clostridium sp.]